jgi:hypothetical protein
MTDESEYWVLFVFCFVGCAANCPFSFTRSHAAYHILLQQTSPLRIEHVALDAFELFGMPAVEGEGTIHRRQLEKMENLQGLQCVERSDESPRDQA